MKYKIREKLFGANKASAIGTSLTLNDTVKYPINKLTIDGVCEQNTTTGKNLLDLSNLTSRVWNGITITRREDDSYSFSGTATNSTSFTLPLNLTLLPGTYTFSFGTVQGFLVRLEDENNAEVFKINDNVKNVTVTLTEEKQIKRLYFWASSGNTYNKDVFPQLEQGSQATDYEPYTGGQPSPNPDYPQKIKTLTGNIKVTSAGKNLFDYVSNLKTSSDGLTSVINEDGSITTTGKPSADYRVLVNPIDITDILEDGQKYTISQANLSNKLYIQISAKKADGTLSYYYLLNKLSQQITVNKSVYVSYRLIISTGVLKNWGDTSLTITNKYMLCKGTDTADTSFEPYQGSSLNITIPENEFVGKIGDIKDTLNVVYKDDGHYHLILKKMIGKIVLDGTQQIIYSTTINDDKFVAQFNANIKGKSQLISNKFTYMVNGWSANAENISYGGSLAKLIQIKILQSRLNTINASGMNEYMANNPTEVYHILETPYEIDLGIVDTLLSYDEITNIFTDSDLYPVINVDYYRESLDISNYEFSIKEV